MIRIALAISHTPWISERFESMARLREQLGVTAIVNTRYREFTERAPNHVWSEQLWTWLAETDATHCLVLQDDVIVAPNFWPALHAMLEAVPDQVIGLETVHPAAPALAEAGHRWLTTSEGLVGVGYVMPRDLLVEFLTWRASALKPGAIEAISEDTLLCCWLLATGRKCWHPLPTIIDHDTSIASTYGNDGHGNRRPKVRWDTVPDGASSWENPTAWRRSADSVPHLGRFYEAGLPALCLRWVEGFTEADYARAVQDDGRDVKRRLVYAREAKREGERTHRVMIATPTRGDVSVAYAQTIWRLVNDSSVCVELPYELTNARLEQADLVRTRSRMVRQFLEGPATHLLFVDSDVSFAPALLRRLLMLDRDVVLVPYPKRDAIDWDALDREDPLGRPLRARAYRYKLGIAGKEITPDSHGCIAVEHGPLGCALLSRACLERMIEGYGTEEPFGTPTFLDGGHRTVALFQLLPLASGDLLSEDQSFCARWRAMGGEVFAYLGPGSPATHHGAFAFEGDIGAFGLRREEG